MTHIDTANTKAFPGSIWLMTISTAGLLS